jgi:carboxypeptidase Taq
MSYLKISELQNELFHLRQALGLLFWDNSVNLASGGVEQRGLTISALEKMRNQKMKSSEVQNWIKEAEQENLTDLQLRELKLFKKNYDLERVVPTALNQELTELSLKTEFAWRKLRFENDWKSLEPSLARLVHLTKEVAKHQSEVTQMSLYNTMMEQNFEGGGVEYFDGLFTEVKDFVVQNFQKVPAKKYPLFGGSKEQQMALNKKVLPAIGFSFRRAVWTKPRIHFVVVLWVKRG